MREVFKDIPGFEGIYQVSNLGRVKSLDKLVPHKVGFITVKERILKVGFNTSGYYPHMKVSFGACISSLVYFILLTCW